MSSEVRRTDYHVHFTRDNEGIPVLDPVFAAAKKNGVVSMALMLRAETPNNFAAIIEEGERQGIEVFAGIEYLARLGGKLTPVIALGFEPDNVGIQDVLGPEAKMSQNIAVAKHQYELLKREGFTFDGLDKKQATLLENVLAGRITQKAASLCGLITENGSNAAALETLIETNRETYENMRQEELFKSKPELLNREFLRRHYFDVGKEGYVPIQLTATEFINLIHQAGGAVLLSHEPPKSPFTWEVWDQLKDLGIDGITAWHGGKLDKEIVATCVRLRKEGYLTLGGSDHDPEKDHWQVGVGDGDLYMSIRRGKELEGKLREIRNRVGLKN
jgi:hypothetical protein